MYTGTYQPENEFYEEKPKRSAEAYQLASFSDRFIALLIDFLIVGVISTFIAMLTGRSEAGVATFFITQVAYQWYFLVQSKGQTPGKALKHLSVVKTDGTAITSADVLVRVVGYQLNNIFMLGWIWALFDENRQGWHDKLTNTLVVNQE